MDDPQETLREVLRTATFPTLIEIGDALLTLTVKSKETGDLDIDRVYDPNHDLQFTPSKSYRFNSIVRILREYMSNKEWFDPIILKGKKRQEVITIWNLLINAFLSKKLHEIAKLRELQGDTRSRNAHQKASSIIAGLEYPVTSGKDAQQIKGIGPKIAEKIDLLLANGDLEELKKLEDRESVIKLFSFWGSNTTTATSWYNAGYRKIEDLIAADDQREINLTKLQKMAIRHLSDFEVAITVPDAFHIMSLVKGSVPPGFEVILVGSFRRGKRASKDCDILVVGEKTPQTTAQIAGNLSQIADIEIAALGPHVFMGVIKMPSGVWKRLDVFVASKSERGCALLAHTGPAQYNIRIRAAAKDKGWTLNERTLINEHFDIISTPTEEDVQKVLGFPVQNPEDRN
jgi:DNA polymerase/3'-5' exonuclease PolX